MGPGHFRNESKQFMVTDYIREEIIKAGVYFFLIDLKKAFDLRRSLGAYCSFHSKLSSTGEATRYRL